MRHKLTKLSKLRREKSRRKNAGIMIAIAMLIASLIGFGAPQNVQEENQTLTLPLPEITPTPENSTSVENVTEPVEPLPVPTPENVTIPEDIPVSENVTEGNETQPELIPALNASESSPENVSIDTLPINLTKPKLHAKKASFALDEKPTFTFEYKTFEKSLIKNASAEPFNKSLTKNASAQTLEEFDQNASQETLGSVNASEEEPEAQKSSGKGAPDKPHKAVKKWATENETIEAFVYDSSGRLTDIEPELEELSEGEIEITLPQKRALRAGVYRVGVELVKDEQMYVVNQEFPWGLISVNTKKSIYKPGETAEFIIVVLDKEGHSVCDAAISMTVTNPSNERTTYSTADGTIVPGEECGLYHAEYLTVIEGNHTIDVTAQTLEKFDQNASAVDGMNVSFATNFSVQREYGFEILREAQSKIDPTQQERFDIKIDIASFIETGADFVTVKEFVPAAFEVTTTDATSVLLEEDTRMITWHKKLVEGTTSVNYSYSVPHVWPYLYALGPLELEYTEQTFIEARPWYVAVDPLTVINVQSYPTVGGNWTVLFTTTGRANLNITAVDGTTWSTTDEATDLQFLEVKCGEAVLDYEWINNSVFIENYECNETGSEVSKVLTSGKHTLEFRFGGDVKYAYNDAGGSNVTQIHYRWRNDDGYEPNKTFSATTDDGYLQASNATYSTAQNASIGTVNTSGNEIRVGQQLMGGTYNIDRSTLFFNTSAIPDDAVISNATLTLYVSGDNSATDFDIQIQRPTLNLSEKATTTITNVYQIHGQDYDGSQYIYWSSRNQAADSLTKMDKDTITTYTTYDPTGHDGLTFRDEYVLYCTANSKVYVVAQDAGDSNHMTLYEFNPSNSSYVQKIDFNDASIPGGLVYAFGYLWTGSRNGYVYQVNLSDFSYNTYDFGTDSDNLHWLGANSNYVWGTSVESNSSLLNIYPNGTKAGHWQVGYQITDDNYVDDSKVYMNREVTASGISVFNISSMQFTHYTSSGATTGYGLWRWNFTTIYGDTEDWLVACYGGSDHIIWYEKSTVAEIRRVNTYTDFTTQLDSPNDIQVIGDYLYVCSWTANPTRICKYRLDKPEITSPLEAADYNKDFYRKNGGTFNTSGISCSGTIEIPLSTTGINWINKTGNTTLNLRSSRDINSNTPTGDEYITFYSANKGSGYEPVLTVTYQNQTPATWKAAEDTNVTVQAKNENMRVRFSVQNTGANASNYNYRLQVAAKGAVASCEEVASGNFADVPTVTGGCSSAVACMNNSTYFGDQDTTTRQLSVPDCLTFKAGKMVENPSNQTTAFTLNNNRFTEFEYNFYFTNNATSGTTYCFRISNASVPLDNYTKVATVTLSVAYATTLQIRNQTASLNVTSINVSGTSGYTITDPYNNVDGNTSRQNTSTKIPVVTIYNPSSSPTYRIWIRVEEVSNWDYIISEEKFNVTADATDPGDVSTWTLLNPWGSDKDSGVTVAAGSFKDLYLAFELRRSGTGNATISVLGEMA